MANPMAPSTTPSQKDEMLLRVGSPSVSFGSSLITSGGGQYRLGASLNNLMSARAMSSGGTNTHAFVTETIGLQAPTTPTRTTAHALVNFEALEVFTSTLPVAAASAQVYEQIISMNQ
jgi:hypothetical protein